MPETARRFLSKVVIIPEHVYQPVRDMDGKLVRLTMGRVIAESESVAGVITVEFPGRVIHTYTPAESVHIEIMEDDEVIQVEALTRAV